MFCRIARTLAWLDVIAAVILNQDGMKDKSRCIVTAQRSSILFVLLSILMFCSLYPVHCCKNLALLVVFSGSLSEWSSLMFCFIRKMPSHLAGLLVQSGGCDVPD